MRITISIVLLGLLLSIPMHVEAAANWPAWRGQDHTGNTKASNPPTTWSETENVKWKTALPGEGQSTPIIWGDRIFLQTAIPIGEDDGKVLPAFGAGGPTSKKIKVPYKFVVLCLDRITGSILWQTEVVEALPHEGHHPSGSLAPYTPVTDGKYVWCSFGSRGLYCLDYDGAIIWKKAGTPLNMAGRFGEGSSPLLYKNTIVVLADHEGPSAITAYDKITGEPVWKQDRDEISSWSTPILKNVNGRDEIITSASNAIRSYNAATGELIWQCSGLTNCAAASPVVADGFVYCSTGFRGISTMAIELGHEGDLTGTDAVKWSSNKVGTNVPSPLVYDNRLYVLRGYSSDLSCFDVTSGALLYHRERIEGMKTIYASPLLINDHIYFNGRNGVTTILKAGDTFEIVQTNQLDAVLDGSPVLLENELFLRGRKVLYCIADKY